MVRCLSLLMRVENCIVGMERCLKSVRFYHDIQAVHVYEDTLYYTTTDNGVTGALHDAPDNPLVTQSSDGTFFDGR